MNAIEQTCSHNIREMGQSYLKIIYFTEFYSQPNICIQIASRILSLIFSIDISLTQRFVSIVEDALPRLTLQTTSYMSYIFLTISLANYPCLTSNQMYGQFYISICYYDLATEKLKRHVTFGPATSGEILFENTTKTRQFKYIGNFTSKN